MMILIRLGKKKKLIYSRISVKRLRHRRTCYGRMFCLVPNGTVVVDHDKIIVGEVTVSLFKETNKMKSLFVEGIDDMPMTVEKPVRVDGSILPLELFSDYQLDISGIKR